MNWALGILNASQASYLPLQNNAILTNRRFEIVGATQIKESNHSVALFCFYFYDVLELIWHHDCAA